MSPSRRGVLAGAGALGAALLSGCGTSKPARKPSGTTRHRYADADPAQQHGDLYLPSASTKAPVGTAVLLHGGFWLDQYAADLMEPMARDLVGRGWAVWNLEYRRLGSGGGWPATFTDVAAGIDHLSRLDGVTPDRTVVLGHSAGGHLAAWAASRTAKTPGGAPRVPLRGVVSLAGVLDLATGEPQDLGGGVIDRLLGGTPAQVPDNYRLGDPTALVPASCPVVAMRGTSDDVVPREQATAYLSAAKAAGGEARLVEFGGDHFTIIDPASETWPTVVRALDDLRA